MTCNGCHGDFIVTLVRVQRDGTEIHLCRECFFPGVAPALGRTPATKAKVRR